MQFGKLAPKWHPKTLKLLSYLQDRGLPVSPSKNYWEYLVKSWPMFGNDVLGDCVFACGGHMLQNFTAHTGAEVVPTQDEIEAAYSAVGGYVPGNPSTDNGAAITDFLSWWQKNPLHGHTIAGWAQINHSVVDMLKLGIYLFGGIDVGIQVPAVAMQQFNAGMPFDATGNDGEIEGGHSIPLLGYGAGGFACITWGKVQYMTNAFATLYLDEAYAVITPDWIKQATQKTPSGFDLATLQADIAAMND